MAQMRHLLVDCDDVLLDWIGGFADWVRLNHGLNPDEDGPGDWDMSTWLGIPQARSLELVHQFNASEAFGELQPRLDAGILVPSLARQGFKLTVITSCSAAMAVVERRKMNLYRAFGPIFDRIICLPLMESKAATLGMFERCIWVEDNYRNALMGAAMGHRTIVMRRPHNLSHEDEGRDDIEWMNNWSDIVSLLSSRNTPVRDSRARYFW